MEKRNLTPEDRKELLDCVSKAFFDARKRAGLSQEKMAIRINTEATYISRLEKGMYFPSIPYLQQMSYALNCSADYLIGTSSYHKLAQKGSIDDRLLTAIDTLNVEEKYKLLELLEKKREEKSSL